MNFEHIEDAVEELTQAFRENIKKHWIQALRSGNYKQDRIYLCDCFDVLAEVIGAEKKINCDGQVSYSLKNYVGVTSSDCTTVVPTDWLGIPQYKITKLVDMNDTGRPFSEIADWIEANV